MRAARSKARRPKSRQARRAAKAPRRLLSNRQLDALVDSNVETLRRLARH